MNIAGLGIICTRGRGPSALLQALATGWVAPATVAVRGAAGDRLNVYAVPPEALSDKTLLAQARRADRFSRMAVLAAADALGDSGLATCMDKARIGVILATALGPHATTFNFLDGILDFGEAAASPTAFSHSVHNAANSYIAMTLGLRGPTLTVTHFHFAFHQAALLAQAWLQEHRCDAVLVGVAEELGTVMEYASSRLLTPATDGRLKPFAFSNAPETVPGEGSVFFLLTPDTAGAAYGQLDVALDRAPNVAEPRTALHLLDTFAVTWDEIGYRNLVIPGLVAASYTPLFGSIMTGSAFHAAAAACMLKGQQRYACPVQDNPHQVPLCAETAAGSLREVLCTRLDCSGRRADLRLTPHSLR
jgi:3-oxoacyl-[acyl-carrier-protein] synthase II